MELVDMQDLKSCSLKASTGSIPVWGTIIIDMACHYLQMKNSDEFYRKMQNRDADIILKMAKCVLSAYKRSKPSIDIFDITFKVLDDGLVFTIDKPQYKELLGNCMKDLIEMEEYEMCGEIKKILEGKKRGRKLKTETF